MGFGQVVGVFVGELRLLGARHERRCNGTAEKRRAAGGEQMTARQIHCDPPLRAYDTLGVVAPLLAWTDH